MPPKKTAQAKHLGRMASTVHAISASGAVVKNYLVWSDLAPAVKADPRIVFAKCLVLPNSTPKEYVLRQVEPEGAENEVFNAPLQRVWNANEETMDPMALRDIGLLQHQNTPAVLDFLKQRFLQDVIYTTADPLLVAINPFRDLGNCTDDIIIKYRDAPNVTRLPPHAFAISREALDNLHGVNKSQTIIVTGESGAGKTEATKHCMRFFASAKSGMDLRIQKAVMAANPVLEAFGNAKTIRNNNSSRFGRFMQLVLAKGGGILNGKVQGFLLEKVRVVSQQKNERSFHIFYQLLKGATSEERQKYMLMDITKYANLTAKSGGCPDAPGIDDLEEFNEVRESLRQIQLSPDEISSIFSIVAGVLMLGNVEFEGQNIAGQDNAAVLKAGSDEVLKKACKLLFLDDPDTVNEGLRTTMKQMGKETVTVRVQKNEAETLTQSLGKAMYDNLFKWIILRLNKTIEPESFTTFMGMLDIFGFEIFEDNSLEQLLINITNEFLQKNFVDIVFERESKLYRSEGVSTAELVFTDNKAVIQCLIDRKLSVFSLLEDACVTKGTADKAFYGKMCSTLSSLPSFKTPPGGNQDLVFTICHTIADINYSAVGFIYKNMDILKAELAEVAQASPNPVVREMFADVSVERGKLAKGSLIANQFLRQLDEMMGIILTTEPHFIRCVKPNETKKPRDWEADKVLNQLFSLSILEALQLKKLGFSWRRTFAEFIHQFRFLRLDLSDRMQKTTDPNEQKAIALEMIADLKKRHDKNSFVEGKDYQLGKTMVFMKPETQQATIMIQRQAMEEYVPAATLLQAVNARRLLKRDALKRTGPCVRLQSLARQRLHAMGTPVAREAAPPAIF